MKKEGKYIYCIIETSSERNFGPIGIGGRGNEVLTISYKDLSAVISNHPLNKFVISRDNMLAHEKVIEKVMEEFDSVLPIRFGTIASDADEIRNLLDRGEREFKRLLEDMNHKVELGVKGVWRDMKVIFEEIVQENKEIKKAREELKRDPGKQSMQAKMEVGKMVAQALEKKKEQEGEMIVNALRRTSIDHKLNKTMGDEMFINASFLVDKGREKEFDNIMDDLSEKYKQRTKFIYAGPLPVYNFVNLAIYPEEWKK